MGRLTREKIENINRSYRENPNYARVAEKEGVNWRTVRKHATQTEPEQTIQGQGKNEKGELNYGPSSGQGRRAESSQAFRLMKKGRGLVDIAIELGLEERQLVDYHRQFLRLKHFYGLDRLYEELGTEDKVLAAFTELYYRMDQEGMIVQVKEFVELLKEERELKNATGKLVEKKNALNDVQTEYESTSAELNKMEERIKTLQNKSNDYENNVRKFQSQLGNIEQTLYELNNHPQYKNLLDAILRRIIENIKNKDERIQSFTQAAIIASRSIPKTIGNSSLIIWVCISSLMQLGNLDTLPYAANFMN